MGRRPLRVSIDTGTYRRANLEIVSSNAASTRQEGVGVETIPVVVPQMGVVEEFIVLQWHVDDGSSVSEGQVLATIETEKAEVEVESPATGKLEILIPAGPEPVQVSETLGSIGTG